MDTFDRIEQLLRERGMKQADLARATGISTGLISQWKNRSQQPSSRKLQLIADYFGVTVDALLGGGEAAGAGQDAGKETAVTVYDEQDNVIRLDEETLQIIDSLRTRPDMKMLFSVSAKATPEDVIKTVKIIEALRDESEGQ